MAVFKFSSMYGEVKAVIAIYSHNGYEPAQSSDYDKEREAQKLIQELNAAN